MGWALGGAIFVIIWWTVLFAVLPIGVRTQAEAGDVEPGTPGSAPVMARIGAKFALTTVISIVIFVAFYAVMEYRLFTLDDIPFLPRF